MKIIEKLTNNSILLIPNNIKNKVLEEINKIDKIYNIKIMNLEEFKKNYFFDYDYNSILFLMDKYNLNIDISKTIMKLLYVIDYKKYENSKLSYLVEIRNELDKNNLLYYNPLFKSYLLDKKIFIYGYTNLSKLDESIINKLSDKIEIVEDEIKKINNQVLVFDTLEEEVEYVFCSICELVHNGVKPSKIKLVNVVSNYNYTLKRYSKIFNIHIDIKNSSIYSSNICKYFLNDLYSTKSFIETLNNLKDKYPLQNEINSKIYDVLFNICNKYNDSDYSFDNVYKMIVDDIKNSSIPNENYEEVITIQNLENNIFLDDEYVFLLGFNQENIPTFYKDEDYIEDNLKVKYKLSLDLTEEKNTKSYESILKSINKINNLIITSKKKSISEEFTISNLYQDLGYTIIEKKIDIKKSYSNLNLKLKLGKYLDDFIKYDSYNDDISLLYKNTDIDYLNYSNKYNKIDKNDLLNYLKKGLILSYTSLDNYYHCAFKYYISNILKIDSFEESFSTILGSFFHYILSICYKNDFDFDKEYDLYISKLELTSKDKFFLNRLKEELKNVIEQVKLLQEETGLTNLLLEHKIRLDKSTVIPVSFVGIVDKIMYKEKNNDTLVSIIDYKTGKADINLYNVIYGLSMQLPIYLYVVDKSNLFSNVKFTGFYLQKILSSEVAFSLSKTYKEQKISNLKLEGYSNSDISKLEIFIPDYEDSKFVKSMKMTSKGFSHYTKVLNDSEIENLIKIVDKNIDDARDNIINGNFEINPKQIGTERVGCNFCKYRDICYKTNNDFKKLKENTSLSFLGGE